MNSRKMPEAAKLYFKNWDVLDTARDELISVLDDFWPETWPVIKESLEESQAELPRVWENKASPGKWSLGYGPGKQPRDAKRMKPESLKMEVWIWDPRWSDNSGCYSVRLRCSAANQQRLEDAWPGSRERINRLAKERGLELDWDSANRIWEYEVPVDPNDLTKTWSTVAETAVELLAFLEEAKELVGAKV